MARAGTQGKEPLSFTWASGERWNREVTPETPLDPDVGIYHFKGQMPALLASEEPSPLFAWWRECDAAFSKGLDV